METQNVTDPCPELDIYTLSQDGVFFWGIVPPVSSEIWIHPLDWGALW